MRSGLTPERWERLKRLFEEALALEPEDREKLVDSVCSEDPGLGNELLRLLEGHEKTSTDSEEPFLQLQEILSEAPEISENDVLAGRFRIVARLGKGGQAWVFKAYDSELEEHVALKAIRGELARRPESVARLKREIQLARKVTHPNVCRIYDLDRHQLSNGRQLVFLTMELIEGETLADRLGRVKKMTLDEALPIIGQVCGALEAAHREGVVHRDLKPSNVMLRESPDGSAKAIVTDFGVARHVSGQESTKLTQTGRLLGTPDYMAPEQLRGETSGTTADIYALGLLSYEMVTGQRPFRGASPIDTAIKKMQGPPPLSETLAPELSPTWVRTLTRSLDPDPSMRFQSPGEFLDHLSGDETAVAQEWTPKRPPKSRRSQLVPAALALSVLAILVIAYYLIPQLVDGVSTPIEQIRVAVPAPSINDGIEQQESDHVSFVVHEATLNALATLRAIEAIAPEDLGATKASAMDIQKELAADEVLQTIVHCGDDECSVSFRRLHDGKTFQGSLPFNIPSGRPNALDAGDAVTAYALRLYSGQGDEDPVSSVIEHKEYLLYLDLKRRYSGGAVLGLEELKQLEELAGTAPRFLPAYILTADAARILGEFERGLRGLRQAETLFPEDPRPVYARFNLEIGLNDITSARATLARLKRSSPGDERVLLAERVLLQTEGRLEDATRIAEQLVQRRPSWQNLWRLGTMETHLGKAESAREHFKMALDRSPGNAWVLSSLAFLELNYGNLNRAEEYYRHLIDQEAALGHLTSLCWVLYLDRRYQEAIDSCNRALEIAPDDALALFNLAAATHASGQIRGALGIYRQILALLGDDKRLELSPQENMFKAKSLVMLDRPQPARALVESTLEREPQPWTFYQAAAVYALASEQVGPQERTEMRAHVIVNMAKALRNHLHPRWFRVPDFDALRADPDFQGQIEFHAGAR